MSDLERARLIPVSGANDTPDMDHAIDVQFNPVTLRVNLSNTLKTNQNQGNSRATQFVDKSSSTLTLELVFDTTFTEAPAGSGQSAGSGQGNGDRIEQGSDVRLQTRKIADTFIKPLESGNQMQAPNRVLFQWGSFEFIGMVQTYDETLDFFSPKGRPLRATVSMKLSEDRYQFRGNDSDALAAEQIPTLAFTGNGADSGGDQNSSPVPGGSDGPGNWRDNAMFNGIESPRMPSVSTLALPSVGLSAGAGFGIGGGVGIGLGAGGGVSGSFGASLPADVKLSGGGATETSGGGGATNKNGASSAGQTAPVGAGTPSPAFRFGNSAALGTGIPGAFNPNPITGLKASGLQSGSRRLRAEATATSASGAAIPIGETTRPARAPGAVVTDDRKRHGVSVAALLKNTPDSGVGFD